MAKKSPVGTKLGAIAKKLAKTRPDKAYPLLYAAFTYVAASGDVARATQLVDWMYGGRVPRPEKVATAISTPALDAFCAAAAIGDRTKGEPTWPATTEPRPPLEARARDAGRLVRWRTMNDRYEGNRLAREQWRALPSTDPWRRINQWRDIQEAAAPTPEGDPGANDAAALGLLIELFDELGPHERGAGYGDELIVGLDVALRRGREDLARSWIARRATSLTSQPFHLEALLCLPTVATAITRGLLRDTIGLSEAELEAALGALQAALSTAAAAPPKRVPEIQRRRVSAEYSQVHLEPEKLDEVEKGQQFFMEGFESDQAMSLFPTRVGIGTPSETAFVDAEVTVDPASASSDLDGGVQAISFPISVRGPICLRNVGTNEDEEPLEMAPGSYEVLARFFPKKAPRAEAAANLRVYTLRLSFRPPGSLGAPRCIALAYGPLPEYGAR